jgi:hypothetical protein
MNIALWVKHHETRRNLEQQQARIILETGEDEPATNKATAAGDSRKLRGIPAIGYGVTGAIPGTRPGDRL